MYTATTKSPRSFLVPTTFSPQEVKDRARCAERVKKAFKDDALDAWSYSASVMMDKHIRESVLHDLMKQVPRCCEHCGEALQEGWGDTHDGADALCCGCDWNAGACF